MFNKFKPGDFGQRLDGSIVRFERIPVYLRVLSEREFSVSPVNLHNPDFKPISIKPNDDRLDISTIPLGYFQNGNECYWIQRIPLRRYRQGVCPTNSVVFSGPEAKGNADWSIINCKGFEDMVLGVRKTLDEAIRLLITEKYNSVAISKDLAIRRKSGMFFLFYKREEIGWISPGEKIVKIPSESSAWIISNYLEPYGWRVE